MLYRKRRFLTNVGDGINEKFFILVRLSIRLSDIQIIRNQAKLRVVDRKSPRARGFNFFVVLVFFYDMLANDKSGSLC